MEFQINYMAVVVAAVVNMALGTVWYGPLFGQYWLKLRGLTKADIEKQAKEANMPKIYVLAALSSLVMAYVFAHFVQLGGNATAMDGAMIGFWLWLGFIATTTISIVLWEGKSWSLWILNSGYYLVLLLINGAILAVWK